MQKKTNLSKVTFDDPGYATPDSVSLNDEKLIDQSETD